VSENDYKVKQIIEENPKGIPIYDIVKKSGLSYPTVKRIVIDLGGYEIVKEKVIRHKTVFIVKKIEGDENVRS
jgi:uncharacterized membrane protein